MLMEIHQREGVDDRVILTEIAVVAAVKLSSVPPTPRHGS